MNIQIKVQKAESCKKVSTIRKNGNLHYTGEQPIYIPDSVVIAAAVKKLNLDPNDGWHFYAPHNGKVPMGKTLRTASGKISKQVDQFPVSVEVEGYEYKYLNCSSKGYFAWVKK